MRVPIVRSAAAVVIVGLLLVSLPAAAVARTSVDPSTLTPPPPAAFDPVCYRDGVQTICDINFSDSAVNDDSGVLCPSATGDLLQSQVRTVSGQRYYDSAGLLTRRHFHEDFVGSFTSADTGLTVQYSGHDTIDHYLSVPGDVTSGDFTVTGLQTRVYQAPGGTVVMQVGRAVIEEASGNLIGETGKFAFDRYFSGDPTALEPLCQALGVG